MLAGHTAVDGSLGHGSTDFCDKTRIDGLGNEIVSSECEIVHLVDIIDDVGYGLLGQVCNSVDGSQFHLFVDGGGVDVEGSPEDVGEADDIIYLIRIVSSSCGHQYVRTGFHRILITDFRNGIGESEDDRILGHRLDHLLREHIALGEAHEHVGTADGLCQRVDVGARGGEEALLLVQVGALSGDDALGVEHHDVLLAGAYRHIEFCT